MENNELPALAGTPAGRLQDGIQIIKEVLPFIIEKRDKAVAGLSLVKQVTNDAEDAIANNMLIKGKVTFDQVAEKRKSGTEKLDYFKADVMTFEKDIAAELDRIRGLRNAYANKKASEENAALTKIAAEKVKADALIKLKADLKEAVVNGCVAALETMNKNVSAFVGTITLQNWDEYTKKFTFTPKLKEDAYNLFFSVDFNTTLISAEEYQAVVADVKKEMPYENVNADYIKTAIPVMKIWTDSLPALKAKLAGADQGTPVADTAQQIQKAISNDQQAKVAEIKEEASHSQLSNDFKAQVASQAIPASIPKNSTKVRKAVITAADQDIVKVMSRVLLKCYSHPKFKGHIERSKTGHPLPPDENGIPVYRAWMQELLDFFANETDGSTGIGGIEIKEIISTKVSKSK